MDKSKSKKIDMTPLVIKSAAEIYRDNLLNEIKELKQLTREIKDCINHMMFKGDDGSDCEIDLTADSEDEYSE